MPPPGTACAGGGASLILGTMEGNPGGAAPADRPDPLRRHWPGLDRQRVSDAEREKAIDQLWARYDEGRLSYDTFALRMEAAVHARARSELAGLLADLPSPHRLTGALRSCWRRGRAALAGAVPRAARGGRAAGARGSRPARRPGSPSAGTPACDMVLPDPTVSRWHAGLRRADSGWLLDDLGSTNGTTLNGWRVRAWVPVRDGDLVSFGAATFVFGSRPGPAAPRPRSAGRAAEPAAGRDPRPGGPARACPSRPRGPRRVMA